VAAVDAVDLNADVGESYGIWKLGDDRAMLRVVTSANVACGFHAGDPSTLRAVCVDAVTNGVTIGAQVSYPDLLGFGRRFIDIDPGELRDAVLYQLAALDGFARVAGAAVAYVKPHGALYNTTVGSAEQAGAVVAAVREYGPALAVLGLPDSALLRLAEEAGLEPVPEAFADRAYQSDGRLVPRSQAGSVLVDPEVVARRAAEIAVDGTVTAVDGSTVKVRARSICVHGDTPGAVELVGAVREALETAGVAIRPFAA
jgi:5-oxoprolinase (ATP-hydrolysing) subunit A